MPARPELTSRRAPTLIVLGVLIASGLGVVGWKLYTRYVAAPDSRRPDAGSAVAVANVDATVERTAPANPPDAVSDAGPRPPDVATAAAAIDASAPVDAGPPIVATKLEPTAPGASDSLTITSKPAGARVYLDGADTGETPIKLPATADQHTVALLLPGYELYIAHVDGNGTFDIPLKAAARPRGPAGLKILQCKDEDRYYIFLDGSPTGQTCPSDRIHVEVGKHSVEIYDAVTESRKKYDIEVKDTRLSFRLKLE
jgi:hypothetical protein